MASGAPAWGNRVFGASGQKHEGLKINPKSGKVDPNGTKMTMRHVHAALRERLGVDGAAARYDLGIPAAEKVSLFDPQASTGNPYA